MRTSAEIYRTIEIIKSNIASMRGRTEGRELSATERKAMGELEAELRAQEEERADVLAVEQRAAAFSGWSPDAIVGMNDRLHGNNDGASVAEQRSNLVASVVALPAGQSGGRETVTRDRADAAEMSDLRSFLRGETRASMSSTNANGGYLLPHAAVEQVISLVKDADPFLGRARMFNLNGQATSIEVPVQSAEGAVSWVAEADARPESNSPTFGTQIIQAFEAYGNWFATQQMLDSQPYIEGWLCEEVSKSLLQAAGVKFAAGVGTTEILGAFANTANGYTIRKSGAVDALDASVFPLAFYDLPAVHHPNAVWVMAPATLATITGYAWANLADTPLVSYGSTNGSPTIMGKPVLLCDNAPAIGNGAFPVFFGDIAAAYGIAIHQDVNILRDPYSNKPYVGFYGTLRIGGHPLDNKAGVLIKSDDA